MSRLLVPPLDARIVLELRRGRTFDALQAPLSDNGHCAEIQFCRREAEDEPSAKHPVILMDRPKLRKVERSLLERDQERLLVLRDPLELVDPIAIDEEFGPVLDLFDGERTLAQVRQSLLFRGDLDVPVQDLESFVLDLQEGGWLEGEAFESLWGDEHERFMARDTHAPSRAGVLYAADVESLRHQLAAAVPGPAERSAAAQGTWGIATPHLPIELTADLLRKTLRHLPDPRSLELVVLLGTDHTPGLLPYAVTDRAHETMLGCPPVAGKLVAQLDQRVDWILREEIRHRRAPALEFASLLLMAAYQDECPPVLAVACGQTMLTSAEGNAAAEEFLGTLEAVLPARDRMLLWASAELGHVGPAYGGDPIAAPERDALVARERRGIEPLLSARPDRFERAMRDGAASERPSGAAAFTTLARLLPVGYAGRITGYKSVRPPGPHDGHAGAVGLWFGAPNLAPGAETQ